MVSLVRSVFSKFSLEKKNSASDLSWACANLRDVVDLGSGGLVNPPDNFAQLTDSIWSAAVCGCRWFTRSPTDSIQPKPCFFPRP
jgi:hypothetical protein